MARVVCLGATFERGQDVGRGVPDVQLVDVAPLGAGLTKAMSRSFSIRTSWRASKL